MSLSLRRPPTPNMCPIFPPFRDFDAKPEGRLLAIGPSPERVHGAVPKPLGDIADHSRTSTPRFVTVKTLAALYEIEVGAIYSWIKFEPDFPYRNAGVKKKFLVDAHQFETWLAERTDRQKREHFAIPSAIDLKNIFKNQKSGV
jgi:hypothetical protein